MASPWDKTTAAAAEAEMKKQELQAVLDIAKLLVDRKFKTAQAVDIIARLLGSLIVSQCRGDNLPGLKQHAHDILDCYMQ